MSEYLSIQEKTDKCISHLQSEGFCPSIMDQGLIKLHPTKDEDDGFMTLLIQKYNYTFSYGVPITDEDRIDPNIKSIYQSAAISASYEVKLARIIPYIGTGKTDYALAEVTVYQEHPDDVLPFFDIFWTAIASVITKFHNHVEQLLHDDKGVSNDGTFEESTEKRKPKSDKSAIQVLSQKDTTHTGEPISVSDSEQPDFLQSFLIRLLNEDILLDELTSMGNELLQFTGDITADISKCDHDNIISSYFSIGSSLTREILEIHTNKDNTKNINKSIDTCLSCCKGLFEFAKNIQLTDDQEEKIQAIQTTFLYVTDIWWTRNSSLFNHQLDNDVLIKNIGNLGKKLNDAIKYGNKEDDKYSEFSLELKKTRSILNELEKKAVENNQDQSHETSIDDKPYKERVKTKNQIIPLAVAGAIGLIIIVFLFNSGNNNSETPQTVETPPTSQSKIYLQPDSPTQTEDAIVTPEQETVTVAQEPLQVIDVFAAEGWDAARKKPTGRKSFFSPGRQKIFFFTYYKDYHQQNTQLSYTLFKNQSRLKEGNIKIQGEEDSGYAWVWLESDYLPGEYTVKVFDGGDFVTSFTFRVKETPGENIAEKPIVTEASEPASQPEKDIQPDIPTQPGEMIDTSEQEIVTIARKPLQVIDVFAAKGWDAARKKPTGRRTVFSPGRQKIFFFTYYKNYHKQNTQLTYTLFRNQSRLKDGNIRIQGDEDSGYAWVWLESDYLPGEYTVKVFDGGDFVTSFIFRVKETPGENIVEEPIVTETRELTTTTLLVEKPKKVEKVKALNQDLKMFAPPTDNFE